MFLAGWMTLLQLALTECRTAFILDITYVKILKIQWRAKKANCKTHICAYLYSKQYHQVPDMTDMTDTTDMIQRILNTRPTGHKNGH